MTPSPFTIGSRSWAGRSLLAASVLLTLALGAATLSAPGSASTARAPTLGSDGIGTIRFGLPKAMAVAELNDLFGIPSAHFVNSGCGTRYTEVAWGQLYAEFRLDRFTGYRYLRNGWPPKSFARRRAPPKVVFPTLATSKGITLGSTLAQVRAAYRPLQRVAADWWRSPNQLVFVDDAQRDPVPPTSRIIEIKIGTCGAF